MKKIIATLTLSAVLFTVGCVKKDDKADGGDKKNKIIVATSADYPPYEFHANIDGEDVIVGFDIEKAKWIYVNTLDKNLGFLLISATIDNPNINAQGFLPEGEELKAS